MHFRAANRHVGEAETSSITPQMTLKYTVALRRLNRDDGLASSDAASKSRSGANALVSVWSEIPC
jgi:hypothetical protein